MRNNSPLVSIVIPCYNSKTILKDCLETILKTDYPNFEVIIVDDKSTDGTHELLDKLYGRNPRVRIIRNEKNFGPSKTRNRGIKEAKGKYVAFLETDMEVESGWLKPLVDALEKDSRLGAVQSKTLDINKRNKIHSMGVLFNPHTFWVISPGCGKSKEWQPKSLEMGIGSVGSMIQKRVLDKIGSFDDKIVHNIDDLDLGWRIWLAGYNIRTIPEAITYHWTAKPSSVRSKQTSPFSSELHFHKGSRLLIKNYEIHNILRYLPWLYFAYLIRIVKNLLKGNTLPLRGFLKSIKWSIVNFPDTLSQRRRIQKLRRRTDKEMFEKLAIPGTFFHFYFLYVRHNLQNVKSVFE